MERLLVLAFAIAAIPAQDSPHRFSTRQLHDEFHSEGATFGDLDHDGDVDVVAGPFWYEGPEFEVRHELYEPSVYDVARYSNHFFTFVRDLNGDGWNDVFVIGFPGTTAYWMENPRGGSGHWPAHVALTGVDNESPTLDDLDGDGVPEIVCMRHGRIGWARATEDPTQEWTWRAISDDGFGSRFTHGLGVGDVSGDGRADILWKGGWWEQPDDLEASSSWPYRPFEFTAAGGAQMLVDDIDGDGDADVITSLHAHGFGLAWFEQVERDGERTFERHVVMTDKPEDNPHGVAFGGLHALTLADINGDGLQDVVTGTRYWAHGGRDASDNEPAVLYWFELVRRSDGVEYVPRLIHGDSGVGTQVVAGDVNDDGLLDVVVGNKKGLWVHTQSLEEGVGLPPAAAARRMTVPDGFRVDLIAGEPDLHQPITFCIDDAGRLWVAEAHAYPVRRPDGEGHDRILVFEDRDTDGTFETQQVFADDLNLISGLEVGFGGVWVGAAPYLMFIPDRDGDLVPDGEPEILLDGFGYEDTHETLNAFTWGPDGWLYGCHGVFTHSKVGVPGTPDDERVPMNAAVWRYQPVHREFEVFAWGSSNPWGVAFDDRGQAFITACVIPHLFHVVQNARYHRQAGSHFQPWVYDDIKTIADHLHWEGESPWAGNQHSGEVGGGHAHCGAMIYLGGTWPEQYRNTVFVNNIHGNRVNNDRLRREGAAYVGEHADDFLLANDPWFRGIALKTGPDGNVFLIDWYDKQACHRTSPEIWDRSNGRLYKVSYGDAGPVAVDPGTVDLTAARSAELIELHEHRNEWYVRHARRLLQERGPDAAVHAALRERLAAAGDEPMALRYLWSLHVTGGLTDELALSLLDHRFEYVRAWAVQLMLERGEVTTAARDRLVRLASEDASPAVVLYLAAALPRIDDAGVVEAIAAALLPAGPPPAEEDHNLPLMVWYGVAPWAEREPEMLWRLAVGDRMGSASRFAFRRLAEVGGDAIAVVWRALAETPDASWELAALEELVRVLRERESPSAPDGWAGLYDRWIAKESTAEHAVTLGALFGDERALAEVRATLADTDRDLDRRRWAIETLLAQPDDADVPVFQGLLDDGELVVDALRGLERFDDPQTYELVLARHAAWDADVQRQAVRTLTRRAEYAIPLLEAIRDERVASDVLHDATTRRSIAQLKNADADRLVEELWGASAAPSEDVEAEIERYRQLLGEVDGEPDLAAGRAVFARTCQQCHRLFGEGSDLGPDITGSDRANLDYILFNMLAPSAEVPRDYMLTTVETSDGGVASGLLAKRDDDVVVLRNQFGSETIRMSQVARDGDGQPVIDRLPVSLMPEGQLAGMRDEEVRDLVAYLAAGGQVPMRADATNRQRFFSGHDLSGWDADPAIWTLEDGELVGRAGEDLAQTSYARTHLLLEDFRLVFEVRLVGNRGNSGVMFRGRATDGGIAGYQADIGETWWGKLFESEGRGELHAGAGEEHVLVDGWNTYEILAIEGRVRTAINGVPSVDFLDDAGPREGIVALQVHTSGPIEVRFRKFALELDPDPEDGLITQR